jgi:tetratricopeptide (TPR) repeat protein/CHAT domain-containing protein
LALLYSDQDRYAEAEPMLKRSLAITEKALGPNHLNVANALINLAELCEGQSRNIEAEQLYKRALAIREKALGPDHLDVAVTLNNLGVLLREQGRYAEAEPYLKRSLAIREKLMGVDHPDVADPLHVLAVLYLRQARYGDAEPLFQRALAIREKALGPAHSDVALSLHDLAGLYENQGRYDEAESLYRRSLTIYESVLGPEHPHVATVIDNTALLDKSRGRFGEAEALYQRALAIREKARGPGHSDVAISLNNLASLYLEQGRYGAAEPLHKRSLDIMEKTLGPSHPDFASALGNLAKLYREQGRYGDAESLFRRSLAIREQVLGFDHLDVAYSLNELAGLHLEQGHYTDAERAFKRSIAVLEKSIGAEHRTFAAALNNLAWLYFKESRYSEAEPLYKRALTIEEGSLGAEHPSVAVTLENLATLHANQNRYAEAEPLQERALRIREKTLGPEHALVATSLHNLAVIKVVEGRFADAETLYRRALTIEEKTRGPDHKEVAGTLDNLGRLYGRRLHRFAEAAPLLERALHIYEAVLGPEHPEVSRSFDSLAELYYAQSDWERAAAFWKQSTDILVRRSRRDSATMGQTVTGAAKSETAHAGYQFRSLVKATFRLRKDPNDGASAAATFLTAQWAQSSEAASALAQMAVRQAKGDSALARLVRERQDLVAEWRGKDARLTTARSQPPALRSTDDEQALVVRLASIDARVREIDAALGRDFPDYAVVAGSEPLAIEAVQKLLSEDEALLLFLPTADREPTPEETFIWAVTKTDIRWVRTMAGTSKLADYVAGLRCGLDAAAWRDDNGAKCRSLLGQGSKGNGPLPFSLDVANELYEALFGQIKDLIEGKDLLISASGPLTQLPFQVLVTGSPDKATDTQAMRGINWLIREHALTVLPSVASLAALRERAKASGATLPMIGFGNPLLDGYVGSDAEPAQRARANVACPVAVASIEGEHRGVRAVALRDGLADVAQIRSAPPLPETADELCAVARDLRVRADDIYLGARATVGEVERLSAAGELQKYRLLHFATHGALSGEIVGSSEPGLLLTPPATATEADDGYLSASRIAGLKLDADWVILSACNTAAGGSDDAEALSGLARAFFYAGARSLLVSHWAVNSQAAVKLITSAVGEIARDPRLGRAEALRRAMLAMIDKGAPHESRPAYWAPFVLVGEGGAAR